jgi:sugar phosphate isomerase/epimerase
MRFKLSCADFSFPLLPHDVALKIIALLGFRGVDVGLFAARSHLRPEKELYHPGKNGAALRRRLEQEGLAATDIFLQLHQSFVDFAVNHPDPSRRKFAKEQFLKALDYAAAAGSSHITILPGVIFKSESRAVSLARDAEELSWRVEKAAAMKLTVAIEPHLAACAPARCARPRPWRHPRLRPLYAQRRS